MDTSTDASTPAAAAPPSGGISGSNEVMAKPTRRKFTAAYKLKILAEFAACARGQRGLMLRREGLYSSHLESWKRQRQQGELAALAPKKRGRKPGAANPLSAENARLTNQVARLEQRLHQAEAIIDVQKKLSDLLGLHPTAVQP